MVAFEKHLADTTMASAHFVIPAVHDVATVNPEGYQRNLQAIEEIEALCN